MTLSRRLCMANETQETDAKGGWPFKRRADRKSAKFKLSSRESVHVERKYLYVHTLFVSAHERKIWVCYF